MTFLHLLTYSFQIFSGYFNSRVGLSYVSNQCEYSEFDGAVNCVGGEFSFTSVVDTFCKNMTFWVHKVITIASKVKSSMELCANQFLQARTILFFTHSAVRFLLYVFCFLSGYFNPNPKTEMLYICPVGYFSSGGQANCSLCVDSVLTGAAFCDNGA